MKSIVLAWAALAIALTSAPAAAQQSTNQGACDQWRHGSCVTWHAMPRHEARATGYNVGYNFGRSYSYADIGALPQAVVVRYHLGPNFRYVDEDGRVYVVNPRTYRVVRVIMVP